MRDIPTTEDYRESYNNWNINELYNSSFNQHNWMNSYRSWLSWDVDQQRRERDAMEIQQRAWREQADNWTYFHDRIQQWYPVNVNVNENQHRDDASDGSYEYDDLPDLIDVDDDLPPLEPYGSIPSNPHGRLPSGPPSYPPPPPPLPQSYTNDGHYQLIPSRPVEDDSEMKQALSELDQLIEELSEQTKPFREVQEQNNEEEKIVLPPEVEDTEWSFYARMIKPNWIGELLCLDTYDICDGSKVHILVPQTNFSVRKILNLSKQQEGTLLYIKGTNFDPEHYVIWSQSVDIIPEAPAGSLTSYLRSDLAQSKVRLQSTTRSLIRKFFENHQFLEAHTPEGESKQIHQQMLLNGNFRRVYEFWNTINYQTNKQENNLHFEMDLEDESYTYVFDVVNELFHYLNLSLRDLKNSSYLETIQSTGTVAPTVLSSPLPVISYSYACYLLARPNLLDSEFSLKEIQWLSSFVKKSHGSDLFIIDAFPRSLRPYFSKDGEKSTPNYQTTRSFDIIYRGMKIGSGGQRINDPVELEKNLETYAQNIPNFEEYLETFKWGSPEQAGVQLYLGELWNSFW